MCHWDVTSLRWTQGMTSRPHSDLLRIQAYPEDVMKCSTLTVFENPGPHVIGRPRLAWEESHHCLLIWSAVKVTGGKEVPGYRVHETFRTVHLSAESICCQMGAVSKICGSVLLLCTVVDPSVSHGEGQRYNIQYLLPIPSSSSSSFCGIWCPLLPTACCLDNTTQFLLEWCLHRNVCRLWLIMWAAHQCPLPVTPSVFAN